LLASLKAFGDGPEDEQLLPPDSQQASEAATQETTICDLASDLWTNLNQGQKETFVQAIQKASPPSPDVTVDELNLVLG
jgi:hypothetical protein